MRYRDPATDWWSSGAASPAALRIAEFDQLAARLSAVVGFADTVTRGVEPRPAGYALKRLAEGAWSLEQAEAYVRDVGGE
ncbi:hypothetical protein ACFYZJ_01030 [Streptomyces sp. NPDC001848]|uniref:hypothetical protein n=1 Tax=Streptomyces sp. NPDC001848 TaxID=3364618 RepID=UPI0036A0F039